MGLDMFLDYRRIADSIPGNRRDAHLRYAGKQRDTVPTPWSRSPHGSDQGRSAGRLTTPYYSPHTLLY